MLLSILFVLSSQVFAAGTLDCGPFRIDVKDLDPPLNSALDVYEKGATKFKGYTITYFTEAGVVECEDCTTGATRVHGTDLTFQKGKKSERYSFGGVYGDGELHLELFKEFNNLTCNYTPKE